MPFLKRIKKNYLSFLENRNVGKLVTNGNNYTNKKFSQLLRYLYYAKFFNIAEEGLLFLAPNFSLSEYKKII
jgi:hypothetical protein